MPSASKAVEEVYQDDDFWREVEIEMASRLGAVTRKLVLEGARAAQSVGAIVDFDAIHEEALYVTRTTESMYWGKMAQTTREGLRQALLTWQEQGLGKRGLPDLIDSIEPLFGAERAERIAVTEATRLFAEGNKLAAQMDPNIGGLEWQTAADEHVCLAICEPKDHNIYPKGSAPECPAHVRCLVPETSVVAPGIVSGTRAAYEGLVLRLDTQSGARLTVTPNHLILTSRGFVPAQALNKGDQIFRCTDSQRMATLVNPDYEHRPATIEQIWNALLIAQPMFRRVVPASAEDFHGDGRFVDGHIDIVDAYRFLRRDVDNCPLGEHSNKLGFRSVGATAGPFVALGVNDLLGFSLGNATDGVMRGPNQRFTLGNSQSLPTETISLTPRTWFNTAFKKAHADGIAVNAVALRQSILGLAGQIVSEELLRNIAPAGGHRLRMDRAVSVRQFARTHAVAEGGLADAELAQQVLQQFAGVITPDEIIETGYRHFSGHVYDLQTESSWYVANDIIAHNCRCALIPVSGRYIRAHARKWQGGELPQEAA